MISLECWKNFLIKKQGEQDYACGLYCIVSAATHLGTVVDDGSGVGSVLGNLSAPISKRVMTVGVGDHGVRKLADAAGLAVWRPLRPGVDDLAWRDVGLEHGSLWMVLIRTKFDDPKRIVKSYEDNHYVLVLDVARANVVVADPHPWKPAVHAVSKVAFERWWDAARGPSRRWAGCLYRSSRSA
jgi:hypothetical protein